MVLHMVSPRMITNKNLLNLFQRVVLLFVILLTGFMTGCENGSKSSEENTKDRLTIVTQVASADGNVYVLRRNADEGCSLYQLDNTDKAETLVCSFLSDATALSANGQVCYYVDGETLYAYGITNGASEPLYSLENGCISLNAVTSNYLLFTDETRSKCCIALDTGEITSLHHLTDGSLTTLWTDVENNAFLFWDSESNSICLYHAGDGDAGILMQREQDVSRVMVTACLFQDTLYYAEADGVLYAGANNDLQAVEATEGLKVVGLLPEDDSLLLAIRWNSTKMKLYRLTDNNLEELAIWDARYLYGSCGLFVAENTAYCYLTTDSALHSLPLAV